MYPELVFIYFHEAVSFLFFFHKVFCFVTTYLFYLEMRSFSQECLFIVGKDSLWFIDNSREKGVSLFDWNRHCFPNFSLKYKGTNFVFLPTT